jgi:excisionase family DNA binding protein
MPEPTKTLFLLPGAPDDGGGDPSGPPSGRRRRQVPAPAAAAATPRPLPAVLSERDLREALLTIPDIARLCGVSDKTVRRWIGDGRLVARKFGGQWRVHPQDYAAFLHAAVVPKP